MQVARHEADISVDLFMMYYTQSPYVDFSHAVRHSPFCWVSRPPRQLPPTTNLLRIYSTECWILILLSMMSVGLFIVWASKLGYTGGVPFVKQDIALLPFR